MGDLLVGDLLVGECTSPIRLMDGGTCKAFLIPPPRIDFRSRVVELTLERCIYFILIFNNY